MNRGLLVEYNAFPVNEALVAESISTGKTLVVSGTLQRANALNQNGRVYPREILKREADKYLDTFVKDRRALGELDHPDSSVVNLQNASHIVTDMWWDGDDLKGKVEILDTPAGNILKKLFAAKITLGISSRGMGSVKEVYAEGKNKAQEVQDDFSLLAFDFVSDPSTHKAFLYPEGTVRESIERSSHKSELNEEALLNRNSSLNRKKIDSIIGQIFCDTQGKCSINY